MDSLERMAKETVTQYWLDTCEVGALEYAVKRGAVGATTNPVIVLQVVQQNLSLYKNRIACLIKEYPYENEDQITWRLIEALAQEGAQVLEPIFDVQKGLGRLSIQTNPKYYQNPEALLSQTEHFASLAPNIQVKLPVTQAGIKTIEEVTFLGISINATVSFSVPQAVAVAQAVERGLKRREAIGQEVGSMNSVCTIMVGRCDDWLKEGVAKTQRGPLMLPNALEWAGVAVFKQAYKIFKKEGYATKLLSAAYRNYHQWLEFVGGDIIETIPYKWQKLFNAYNTSITPKIDQDVDARIIENLLQNAPDFDKMYHPKGMEIEDFDNFGPVKKTLHQFLEGYGELVKIVRSVMLPL